MNTFAKRIVLLVLPLMLLSGFVLTNDPESTEIQLTKPAAHRSFDDKKTVSIVEPIPEPIAIPFVMPIAPVVVEEPVVTTTTVVSEDKEEPIQVPASSVVIEEPEVEEPLPMDALAVNDPVVEDTSSDNMCGSLPCCPSVTYDGVLPQDGGTGPVWDTPDGLPPTYDCNGPGNVDLP